MNTRSAIILPAFNKGNDIVEVVKIITHLFSDAGLECKLIIVDDGSTDDTQVKLASIIGEYDFVLISHEINQGKGQAIRTGMQFALQEFGIIGYFDADLDLSAHSLLEALNHILAYDLEILVGSKRHPGSVVEYPVFRRFLSVAFQALSRILIGLNISDSQTGLKLFKGEVLSIILPQTRLTGFAFDLELLAVAKVHGFHPIEFPVEIKYAFSSTVRIRSAARAVLDLFAVRNSIRKIESERL
jgi:glycosyltransferase involved in cell wall biosynthesis